MRLRLVAFLITHQICASVYPFQAQAEAFTRGNLPEIIRNAGASGCKDIHLEDFNVSNGGKDLIADATMMLAFGRRYGLIGRNGTGSWAWSQGGGLPVGLIGRNGTGSWAWSRGAGLPVVIYRGGQVAYGSGPGHAGGGVTGSFILWCRKAW